MSNDKIANPTKFFEHPNEVMQDSSLSTEDKIKLLENWADDIRLKLIAEDENMSSTLSSPKNYMAEINHLLNQMKESSEN